MANRRMANGEWRISECAPCDLATLRPLRPLRLCAPCALATLRPLRHWPFSQTMTQQPSLALFVTCLVDQFVPDVGVAAVRLLRRAGYQVDFPEAQTCCGQPFYNSGFREEARRLAKRLIEIFEPYDVLVAPSGSCVSMVRTEYPHLLGDEKIWQEQARRRVWQPVRLYSTGKPRS